MSVESLTLADYSDRDILSSLVDVADDEGWACAQDVARQIGLDHPRPNQCVGSRLSWLRRYGALDTDRIEGRVCWRLNSVGEAIYRGNKLSATQRRSIDGLSEAARIAAIDSIAASLPSSSRTGTHFARRAWTHRMGGWRDVTLYGE